MKQSKKEKRKHQRDFEDEESIGKAKNQAPAAKAPKMQASTDADSEPESVTGKQRDNLPRSCSLKVRADRLQEILSSLLINAGKSPSFADLKHIASNAARMHAVLMDSLMYCSKLEGHIQALETVLDDQKKTIEEITKEAPSSQTTYAGRVGIKSNVVAYCTQKKDPPNVVKVTPKDSSVAGNSEATKIAVQKIVSPTEQSLNIRNIRNIQGNGILIETPNKRDITALMADQKLKAAGFVVETPAKKNPRIIILDVPKLNSEEDTMETIAEQNLNLEEKQLFRRQSKLAFKTGDKKKESCNWVLETSKEVRNMLLKKSELYIGWTRCRLKDYIVATRCYKCQSFGHTSKYCKSITDTCGHCGTAGHAYKACPNLKKQAVCTNCKRNGRPHDHDIRDKSCPAYEAAINQVISRIDYGK